MKGIILAGGSGTRLYPLTKIISKQLLPVHDKPMIYYSLSVLLLAGIRDILIISTPRDLPQYKALLGNGKRFGIQLSYMEQPSPDGLAQAFILGKSFIAEHAVAMILGDNLFYGDQLQEALAEAAIQADNGISTIFGYYVDNPSRYGVIGFDHNGKVNAIEEKPKQPKSNYCVTGLYFYDQRAAYFAEQVKPSQRGELEITDLNSIYLENQTLKVNILNKSDVWFGMGTVQSIHKAANFVQKKQEEKASLIMAPEVIAYQNGWLTEEELLRAAAEYKNVQYGQFLISLLV